MGRREVLLCLQPMCAHNAPLLRERLQQVRPEQERILVFSPPSNILFDLGEGPAALRSVWILTHAEDR